MPHSSSQQDIDDLAVHAVKGVFIKNKHKAERIGVDFGEDLLVHTFRYTAADPLKILVQIKGTEDPGRMTARVTASHVMKWASTSAPVLIVLWNVKRDTGWYKIVEPYTANLSAGNAKRNQTGASARPTSSTSRPANS